MKKMLVWLATAATLAGTASAQTPAPTPRTGTGRGQGRTAQLTPEQRADRQAQNLTTQLALSADQTAKVRALALAQAQELQALRDQYASAANRPGMGPELKAAQERYNTQLQEVLTADQYAAYTRLREDRATKARQRRSR